MSYYLFLPIQRFGRYLKEESPVVNYESEACYSNHQPGSKLSSRDYGFIHHRWESLSTLNREYAKETYGSKWDASNRAMYKSKGLQIQEISSVLAQRH